MIEHRLLLAGGILLLGVGAAIVARRLSLPLLVLFLALGMVFGSDGPGGIHFDDAKLARELGAVGLVAILFEGGLTARWRELRQVAVPAFLLSTLGVGVTAGVVAVAARELLDLSWAAAFLLVRELGLGLVLGVVLGAVAARLLPRLPIELGPFAPVASVALAAFAYGLADLGGGSGFLAVYMVAVFLGNTVTPHLRTIVSFHEGLAFTAQVGRSSCSACSSSRAGWARWRVPRSR